MKRLNCLAVFVLIALHLGTNVKFYILYCENTYKSVNSPATLHNDTRFLADYSMHNIC